MPHTFQFVLLNLSDLYVSASFKPGTASQNVTQKEKRTLKNMAEEITHQFLDRIKHETEWTPDWKEFGLQEESRDHVSVGIPYPVFDDAKTLGLDYGETYTQKRWVSEGMICKCGKCSGLVV